ncbi:MAG: response regulator [Thermoanaerobaculia bacterium]
MPKEKAKILLVDDNESTCTLISAILRKNADTDICTDGTEALEKLRTRVYDVILLDLKMPGVDGYQILEHLGSEKPAILSRVLVVTAALSERDQAKIRKYPLAGVIAKPFEVEQLAATVDRCLRSNGHSGIGTIFAVGPMMLLLFDVIHHRCM